MEVSKEILNDIADSLEAGFKCFLHQETFEVVTYLDPDQFLDFDADAWKAEINKVKKNKKKFVEIENMPSTESFKVMEEFADSLENGPTKIRLLTTLQGRKPFANFKHQIENAAECRELWFAFRRQKNIEWIQDRLSVVDN